MAELRSSDRKLKPLPPDPVRHQDLAIALRPKRNALFSSFPTRNSLFVEENSLLWLQKFPVPLRREFGCNHLNSLVE